MQGAPAALKKSICWAIRSFSREMSPSSRRPENQPPKTEMPYRFRIGPNSAMSIGKRRPVSMPEKPAALAWRRHSSSDTSSESSTRSSFHHAIGAIPSLAVNMTSNSHALLLADFFLGGARSAHALALGNLWNADVPVRVARHPREGVGRERDDGGAVGCLRPVHRRLEIADALGAPGERAHGFGVFDEIHREGLRDLAVFDEIIEAGHALG